MINDAEAVQSAYQGFIDKGDDHGIDYSGALNRGHYVSIFLLFTARRVWLINEAWLISQSLTASMMPAVALGLNLA